MQGQNEMKLKLKWREESKDSDESTMSVSDHFQSTGPRFLMW